MIDLAGLAGLTLQQPWALAIVPASLLALIVRALWRRRRYVVLPTAHLLPPTAFRPSIFRRLPLVFGLAAVTATAVALADPVVPHSTEDLQSLGIDIMLVLDLSSSMNTEMAGSYVSPDGPKGPTRLDVTRRALRSFINSRHGDRLGLVVLSNYAYVVSPLTVDREYLLRYLDIVDEVATKGHMDALTVADSFGGCTPKGSHASTAVAGTHCGVAGHSMGEVCATQVITGAVLSSTVIVLLHVDVFWQSSVAVQVRVTLYSCGQAPGVVTSLEVITGEGSQASTAVAGTHCGVAGHSMGEVCATQVITGAVLSSTVIVLQHVEVFWHASVAVQVRVTLYSCGQAPGVVTSLKVIVGAASQASVAAGATHCGIAGHSTGDVCVAQVMTGAVLSSTMMVLLQVEVFIQSSVAVQVRVTLYSKGLLLLPFMVLKRVRGLCLLQPNQEKAQQRMFKLNLIRT